MTSEIIFTSTLPVKSSSHLLREDKATRRRNKKLPRIVPCSCRGGCKGYRSEIILYQDHNHNRIQDFVNTSPSLEWQSRLQTPGYASIIVNIKHKSKPWIFNSFDTAHLFSLSNKISFPNHQYTYWLLTTQVLESGSAAIPERLTCQVAYFFKGMCHHLLTFHTLCWILPLTLHPGGIFPLPSSLSLLSSSLLSLPASFLYLFRLSILFLYLYLFFFFCSQEKFHVPSGKVAAEAQVWCLPANFHSKYFSHSS